MIPNDVKVIMETLKANNFESFLVGGCVRDTFLGTEPKDYDIVTNATPEEVNKLFEHTLLVGEKFGVVVVVLNKVQYEVATYRTESNYDGRRPEIVKYAKSIEEDVSRRDFTINGLYMDEDGKIYDKVEGIVDIQLGAVRAIGEPVERFREDYLRMMRAVRFACRFNFIIDKATAEAIYACREGILHISKERLKDELLKILEADPKRGIQLLKELGLLNILLPEISNMIGCTQPPEFHPEGDVYRHTLEVLDILHKDKAHPLLKLAGLLHDVGKPLTRTVEDRIRFSQHDSVGAKEAERILTDYKFSNEEIGYVATLVSQHMKFDCTKDMRTSRLKRFLRQEFIDDMLLLHKADAQSSGGRLETYNFCKDKIEEFKQNPEKVHPVRLITGNDLIARGLTPGPKFKFILEHIEDLQLEGKVTTRIEALQEVEFYLLKEKSELWEKTFKLFNREGL
jgi:poly(A) polymerase